MEMEKVPAAGFPIIGLPIEGLQRKPGFRNLVVFYKLIVSLFKAAGIIKTFGPDVVIGVGGYASGPLLRIAALKGIPTLIQEQNSYAGVTNKLLARKAAKICVAYPGMDRYFPAGKIVLTGNPVREELIQQTDKADACRFFELDPAKPVIVVLGGSLGARMINNSILGQTFLFEKEDVQLVWQTGKLYIDQIRKELENKEVRNIRYYDFINRMDMAYGVADVIISRAGAATISELCLLGKPVILVPSPNVAEDHQTKNAMALVQNQAALMIPDKQAPEKLVQKALELVHDKSLCNELARNSKSMGLPGAAQKIVDEIIKISNQK
jgi:UDP-N-acetylglucosamine--N-acetylmuramyl-(pentapeptide) pyrophosphoryl-undecaprenol N-acetylglucosamine transferase